MYMIQTKPTKTNLQTSRQIASCNNTHLNNVVGNTQFLKASICCTMVTPSGLRTDVGFSTAVGFSVLYLTI